MEKKTDRRSARTKKALKHVMLELLKKKDISKITVSELSELADIGRGTFYLHFADPYDLLERLEDELLEQITVQSAPIMEHVDSSSLLRHLEHIWLYIYEHMDTFKILMNRRNNGRFMEKFKRYCENSVFSANKQNAQKTEAAVTEKYTIIYIISGTLGIFQRWIEDGAPIPPEALARIAGNLIIGPPDA